MSKSKTSMQQAVSRGRTAHLSGQAAENIVARHYSDQGFQIAAERWRGDAGEIDIIAQHDHEYVFIEVKCAKTFDQAAESLGSDQIQRILLAAQEFCGKQALGLLSNMRFDVALVDRSARVQVLENAFNG